MTVYARHIYRKEKLRIELWETPHKAYYSVHIQNRYTYLIKLEMSSTNGHFQFNPILFAILNMNKIICFVGSFSKLYSQSLFTAYTSGIYIQRQMANLTGKKVSVTLPLRNFIFYDHSGNCKAGRAATYPLPPPLIIHSHFPSMSVTQLNLDHKCTSLIYVTFIWNLKVLLKAYFSILFLILLYYQF